VLDIMHKSMICQQNIFTKYKIMKYKLLILSLLLISSFEGFTQKNTKVSNAAKPKLVVGIVVDQMRYDFLYRYDSKYSKGGFKRLLNEGYNCKNLHYNYGPTVTAAGHAAIFTGSIPSVDGIIGNDWFDQANSKNMYCVEDTTVSTVGTTSVAGKMSPKNLVVSTITDQLKIANNFKSKTIGIALKDRGAILPAGHIANGAYWFDSFDGSFITSTFYMKVLPQWVKDFNAQKNANKFINTSWTTLLPIEKYTESTEDDQPYESKLLGETKSVFPHELVGTRGNFYETIKTTPFGNTITKDFALAAIEGENLGKGENTDFLTLSFSSPDYAGHAFGPNSIEVEDVYLRLDKDIEEILNTLDSKFGKNNYLVFLSADHGVADVPGFWKQNKLPAGLLPTVGMRTLANEALKAKFGSAEIIKAEDNSQYYLNYQILKEKSISTTQVYEVIKDAIIGVEGVSDIINLHDLNGSNLPESLLAKIKNGYNAKRSGDIMILSKPQWFGGRPTGTTHGTIYNYDSHVPAVFFGWKVPKGESFDRYSISDIAPTIANMLNILEPSGNIGNPITFK
jgi:predicted AlkP superfamily pyrophosphatase or phosphodiesterase